MNEELLKIICCPETQQSLALADAALIEALNQGIASGQLKNRAGRILAEKLEGGLRRVDGRCVYPLRAGIPILLIDEAIPLVD